MPLHCHGGTPHTKAQQHRKLDDELTLAQAAGQIQHDVDAEPFNTARWERAVETHVAGNRPAPTTGGTLSIGEGVARLRELSISQYAQGMLVEATEHLEANVQQALGALGEGGAADDRQAINDMGQAALQELRETLQYVQRFYEELRRVADKHS